MSVWQSLPAQVSTQVIDSSEHTNPLSLSSKAIGLEELSSGAVEELELVIEYQDAATKGDPDAQYELGKIYVTDEGVLDYAAALYWTQLAAKQHHIGAQFLLGSMFYVGTGVERDYDEAAQWLLLAAEQGHAEAQRHLGYMYRSGQGVRHDETEAVRWFQLAAEQGDFSAQAAVADAYLYGSGVKKDELEAVRLFKRAAEMGSEYAQQKLAKLYLEGEGVEKDAETAAALYQVAAEKGNPEAQKALADMYISGQGIKQDINEGLRWYRLSADQGFSLALLELGLLYEEGRWVEQDYSEAARFYRLAADAGESVAPLNLGFLYHTGRGVGKDERKAAEWYGRSPYPYSELNLALIYERNRGAETKNIKPIHFSLLPEDQNDLRSLPERDFVYSDGKRVIDDEIKDELHWAEQYWWATEHAVPSAQYNLGIIYQDGRGVKKDNGEAAKWYRLAAEQGHPSSQFNLALMHLSGVGVPKNYQEAFRLFELAAKQGEVEAQYNVGVMYFNGEGVPKSYARAYVWYAVAAAHGHAKARDNRDAVEGLMTPEQVAEAQGMAAAMVSGSAREALGEVPSMRESTTPEAQQSQVRLTGTAFFVNERGYLLTNHHVVDECSSVRVLSPGGAQDAQVEAFDQNDDLALLRIDSRPKRVANFREQTAATGEDVLAIGFPLQGLLTSINATTGSVSATTGAQGDRRFLQISAPVQQGNSGGPLLDASGAVIGVIVSKLNAVKVAEVTGDVPQNVNFAIKAAVVRSFLSINDVAVIESSSRKKRDRVEVAAEAEEFTVLVECLE